MSFMDRRLMKSLPTDRMVLTIQHVPTGKTVSFPAYLEMFSDQYSSNWHGEDVYGRMDPIATFINTRRAISIAWNVPAESFAHAKHNVQKVNQLMSFLYPLYDAESGGGATAINQAPLLRISFGNLIRDAKTGRGLIGYVQGFTFDPAVEYGMFYDSVGTNVRNRSRTEYYPKTFRLNTEFNVLHEHSLGYVRANKTNNSFAYKSPRLTDSNFPYATNVAAITSGFDKAAQDATKVSNAGLLPSTATALSVDTTPGSGEAPESIKTPPDQQPGTVGASVLPALVPIGTPGGGEAGGGRSAPKMVRGGWGLHGGDI